MSAAVAGVDGCRDGWLCVIRRAGPLFQERLLLAKTIGEILTHSLAPEVIAIDIPIGSPERVSGPGRGCDRAARKVLGKRAAAVFSVPARAAVNELDYVSACAAAFAASMNGCEPLNEPKKRRGSPHAPGLDFRRALLAAQGFSADFVHAPCPGGAGADDVLDACACALTAARIFKGEAMRFPETPPLDRRGLRMEILA